MAFQLPGLPNLTANIPQTDPVEQAARVAQLRNMMSEQALRQALAPSQIQQAQAQAQQAQQSAELQRIQLQDSQVMSDWLKNGDATAAPGDFSMRDNIATFTGIGKDDSMMGILTGLAKRGMSGPGLLAQAQAMLQRRTEYNKGTEEEQTIRKNDHLYWQEALAELHNAPEDQRSPLLAAKLPLLIENSKSDPVLQAAAKGLAGHPERIDQVFNAVNGDIAALGLRKAGAEATEAEQKVINPATGVSPAQTSELAKEKLEQPLKEQLTRIEATAREQVQASMLPLMEDIRQQYANQKDARDKIDSTVLKPYQDKLTDITTARAAIAQADSNPIAARAAIFKMVGVAQPSGSHRVLPMEFTSFKYPGGIVDRVKEHFNDFLKGEPWTPDIAEAANAFISGQEAAAQTNLNSGIDRTNKLYGTNVGRGLQQAAPVTRTYQGRTYVQQPDGTYKLQQ